MITSLGLASHANVRQALNGSFGVLGPVDIAREEGR
jgi:hypothetical protein